MKMITTVMLTADSNVYLCILFLAVCHIQHVSITFRTETKTKAQYDPREPLCLAVCISICCINISIHY